MYWGNPDNNKYKKERCVIMGKNVVRVVALLLVVLLASTVGLAARQVPKPKQIVAFLDDTMLTPARGQGQFIAEYKKLTGIDLKIIQPVHNQYYEKLRLAFAAGDIPDVIEIAEATFVQYANEGAFVDLTKYIKQSPTLSKVIKKFDAYKIKGKIYGVPKENPTGPITYVRKDWLANLGMKAPTTWDEYYNMLKAFTHNDPDKNGKNDTYGVTAPGPTGDSPISLAKNYYADFWQNADPNFYKKRGKWVDGFSEPAIKPALERLRKVYQEKLMDPEVFTNKTSTCREKFNSGKCGVFTYWSGLWQVRLETDMRKNLGPSASIMPIPPIKGSKYVARVPAMHAVTTKAKNPEGVFKYFIDFSHDGDVGQLLFVHGVENVHWKWENGKRVQLPALDNPKLLNTKAYYDSALNFVPWKDGKDKIEIDERVKQSNNIFDVNCIYDSLQVFTDSRKRVEEPINNAKNDVIVKVMTGAKTVDQALAEYKKKYNELRIDQVLKDMNAASK